MLEFELFALLWLKGVFIQNGDLAFDGEMITETFFPLSPEFPESGRLRGILRGIDHECWSMNRNAISDESYS